MAGLQYFDLGKSKLRVTELCFGTLTLSPIQANISPEKAGKLIRLAIEQGVNFIDTAQGYKNYLHVRKGIEGFDRKRLVIATKSAASTCAEMSVAFDQACEELDIEYIDIFLLHSIRSVDDFRRRKGALDLLKNLKACGRVKAIGVSAHNLMALRYIVGNDDIDVCHPIFNKNGIGIKDGTVSDMVEVVGQLHADGKGVYAMKPLGGGHLADRPIEAFDFIRKQHGVHSIAVGMKDEKEVVFNLAVFRGDSITDCMIQNVTEIKRRLHVNMLCEKCGSCVKACEHDALCMGEDRMQVDATKCVLCGYCVPLCPQFAIRIV